MRIKNWFYLRIVHIGDRFIIYKHKKKWNKNFNISKENYNKNIKRYRF